MLKNTETAKGTEMTKDEKRHSECKVERCGCCQTWNVKLGFACTCKAETKAERLDRIMAMGR